MHFTTKCRAGTLRETLVAFSFTQISAHSIFAPFSSTISRKSWNPVFKQTQGAIFFDDIEQNSVLPYSLISLSLTHFGLLVPLSHNVLKSGSDDGPLELLSPLGTFLGGFFLNTLPVLPSVEDGPCNLTWVPFQKMSTMASAVQKFEDLKQNFSSKHKNSTNVKFLDYLLCHLTWSRSYHG